MRKSTLPVTDLVAIALIFATVAVLFANAPLHGEFWWSDAPRHALNGAFVRDFLIDLPVGNPKQWAVDYYLRYPALTILFYPPMFPVVEAAFFAVLGVSPLAATATVSAFALALGLGTYVLARRWLGRAESLACAVLLLGLPEVALWGRQVMLEIPAFAFLVWSAHCLFRHIETGRPVFLYLAAALLVLAMYTKLSLVFFVPVLALALFHAQGLSVLKNWHTWIVAVVAAIGLVPLVYLTINFGQGNLESVSGIKDSAVSRWSIDGWLWYLRQLPSQLGWVPLAAALVGLGLRVARTDPHLPRIAAFVFLVWFVVGYLFFSAIDLKEARHSVFLLLPVVFLAVTGVGRLAQNYLGGEAARGPAVLVLAGLCLGRTLVYLPAPVVIGENEAAAWIRQNVPPGVVAFAGKRDGSFVFNLRSLDQARAYSIVRVDKLLLSISIRRELGVTEKEVDLATIGALFNRYGIRTIVAEKDFWTDLKSMKAFQDTLATEQFEPMTRIKQRSNIDGAISELVIYKNKGKLADPPETLRIDLPIIGKTVEGATKP